MKFFDVIGMLVFMNQRKSLSFSIYKSFEMLKYLENVMCHECTIKTLEIFFKADLIMNALNLNHTLIYSQHGQLFEVTNGQFCYNVFKMTVCTSLFQISKQKHSVETTLFIQSRTWFVIFIELIKIFL